MANDIKREKNVSNRLYKEAKPIMQEIQKSEKRPSTAGHEFNRR